MNMKIGRDVNGNKTVKIIGNKHCRGFSIQSNGNLPKSHRDNVPNESEVNYWIKNYGTARQKKIFGFY